MKIACIVTIFFTAKIFLTALIAIVLKLDMDASTAKNHKDSSSHKIVHDVRIHRICTTVNDLVTAL